MSSLLRPVTSRPSISFSIASLWFRVGHVQGDKALAYADQSEDPAILVIEVGQLEHHLLGGLASGGCASW